jgi:predicted TIM-barrel fold metal-dependent hydrolase
MPIIDAHIHLGDNRQTKCYPAECMLADLAEAGADGAVVFGFPEDMYRIADTPESRAAANAHVLKTAAAHPHVYPFYFVWNDFVIPDNLADYVGIKWHRHSDEPEYNYEDPRCEAFIRAAADLRMPVTLEEEFHHTAAFIERVKGSGLAVIIPHMGMLNGGHGLMAELFGKEGVYFDTSCAPAEVIGSFLRQLSPERIIFGSDVSGTSEPFFNFPKVERQKVESLDLTPGEHELIFGENVLRLIARTPAGKVDPR